MASSECRACSRSSLLAPTFAHVASEWGFPGSMAAVTKDICRRWVVLRGWITGEWDLRRPKTEERRRSAYRRREAPPCVQQARSGAGRRRAGRYAASPVWCCDADPSPESVSHIDGADDASLVWQAEETDADADAPAARPSAVASRRLKSSDSARCAASTSASRRRSSRLSARDAAASSSASRRRLLRSPTSAADGDDESPPGELGEVLGGRRVLPSSLLVNFLCC